MSDVPAFVLPTGSGELHERDFELAALEAAIVDAKAGESRVVLIEGPAGIGKSRLLLETRARGEAAGFNVLTARGNEFEREFGFGVVRQLLDQAYRSANGNGVFDGPAAAAAAVFDAVPGEDAVVGDGASFAILHGLYWAVANLSEQQPTMLAVDDLHWADMPSLHFLSYLSRRLESMPLVVVATLRPGESGADSTAVRELMSDPSRLSVAPAPLSPDGVAAVIAARLGARPEPEFATACQKATDGNPLLLEELLKETAAAGVRPVAGNVAIVREIGPRAASRAVLLRLARLDDCCLQVARALTVLGEAVPLSTVAELAGTSEAGAAEAVRKCAEVEILRPDAPVGFVHPLVREVVYRDIPPGERELMHERAAKLLQSLHAPAERVAAQLLHVPPRGDAWVSQTLRTAAAFATGKGATSSAITYLERALAEPPPGAQRIEVLRDLGLAEALANRIECIDHLQQVYDALDDPLQRGWMAFILGRVFGYADRAAEAEQILQRTFPDLGEEHSLLRHRLETVRMSVPYIDPAVLSLDFIHEIVDAYEGGGDAVEDRMRDGAVCYGMAMRNDPADECVKVALDAVADGQLYELDPAGFPIIGVLVVLALADSDAVIEVYRKTIAAGHRGGSVLAPAIARGFGGFAMTLRGDLQEAKELLDTATADVIQFDVQMGLSQLAAFNAFLYGELGELDRAEELLESAREDLPEGNQRAWWLSGRMVVYFAQGRFEEALAVADELAERYTGVIDNPAWVPWRAFRAESLLALGRTDEALEAAEVALDAARAWGAPRALGRALRVRGQARGAKGMTDLIEAVELLEHSPAKLEYARALLALGTALRHGRRITESREPLAKALDLASVAGAAPLARRAREELEAAGAGPRATELGGVESLTPSERRVAGLAVEGMTNKQIAQELFVTPKTVEVHLSNVYRKLDIRSRRELPGVFSVAEAA